MASDRPTLTPERLEEAATCLSPAEREALVLGAREGLSTADIAARLNIAPEAAEQLVARALFRLERELRRRERPWWRFW